MLDTGLKVTGKQILAQLYNNHNVNAWGMIGVLLAYIALFRLVHYGLFHTPADSSSSASTVAATKSVQHNSGGGGREGGNGSVDSEKYRTWLSSSSSRVHVHTKSSLNFLCSK